MTPDLLGQEIAEDGTPAGARCKVDFFYVAGTGPILRSPDGTLWKIVVDDNGVLGAQEITIAIQS